VTTPTPESEDLLAAERPIGPYIIERRLATGGMAEVSVARRTGPHGFEKRVALKRILPQYASDAEFVAMFIAEARLAARLTHPNIVQVFDFGELDGDLFLAMELVEGSNVNRLLRTVSGRGETVPLDLALHIGSQTAHALAHAHAARGDDDQKLGFVHRDVSPANILITKDGHVKLTDFGIATIRERSSHTEDGHVRGKLGYMSPEQVLGRPLDATSDVFTLSTVIAELLIAEPLFGTGSELDVLVRIRDVDLGVLERSPERIPRDVHALLRRGLARDPATRPEARVFADACDEIARRRGMGHAPDRLARLLARLRLTERDGPDTDLTEGAGRTSWLDTGMVSTATEEVLSGGDPVSPAIYRVQLEDGAELGPMSFPKLIQLITTGRITASSRVARDRGDFEAASRLAELTRFVTSPALSWRRGEIDGAIRRGRLQAAELIRETWRIAEGRETGVLHLWEGERRKKIYFVDGRPEFVASTDRAELLGEYLVEHGFALRMEVEMALALLPRYGGHLGDALVGLEVLRPVELFRAITQQVRSRVMEAFRWTRGDWGFVDGERSHEETFPLGYEPRELLRDAVNEVHTGELLAALEPLHETLLLPAPALDSLLRAWPIPGAWRQVLLGVRGDAPFSAILARHAQAPGADAEDVYRATYLGLACGLIRPAT